MGVNLRDVFTSYPVPDGWYKGKRIAIDGHNVAFRYLTSIRGPDGGALKSKDTGRTIAHLLGFTGLVRQLRMQGAEPIIVWDGTTHPRKEATVQGRIAKRMETLTRMEEAKAAGDHAKAHQLMRGTVYLDSGMIEDCTRLMDAVGVAVVTADHDGERFATALCHQGHADAVATEDFDALVAGAPWVLRKAGGGEPFLHNLTDLDTQGVSQKQLRQMAVLCGTDWHPGVKGFGAKTVLKALQDYPDLTQVFEEAASGIDATRYHKMVAKSDMTITQFTDLEAFIADLPHPPAPNAPKPSPDMAAAVAKELGLGADRALACLC
jgi:flap endonuclease-1